MDRHYITICKSNICTNDEIEPLGLVGLAGFDIINAALAFRSTFRLGPALSTFSCSFQPTDYSCASVSSIGLCRLTLLELTLSSRKVFDKEVAEIGWAFSSFFRFNELQ